MEISRNSGALYKLSAKEAKKWIEEEKSLNEQRIQRGEKPNDLYLLERIVDDPISRDLRNQQDITGQVTAEIDLFRRLNSLTGNSAPLKTWTDVRS